jgi:hypothetical protein
MRIGDYRYDRVGGFFGDLGELKDKNLEKQARLLEGHISDILGPMLAPWFKWDSFGYELRVSLASAWKDGEMSTAHERYNDAVASTTNMLKALFVGKAMGSGKEEDKELAKFMLGKKAEEKPEETAEVADGG